MRLRTRILLMFGLACAALFVVTAIAVGAWRQAQQDRFNQLVLDTQRLTWHRFEVTALDRLRLLATSLSNQPSLPKAFATKDAESFRRMVPSADGDVRFDAFDTDGNLIFSSSNLLNAELQLDVAGVHKLLDGDRLVAGVTPTIADGLKFVVAVPVRAGNRVIGGIALGLPVSPALQEFASSLDRQAAFVDLRGHAQSGDGAALFNEINARVQLRRAAVAMAPRPSGDLRIALTPITGPDGRQVGSLVTLDSIDDEQTIDQQWSVGISAAALAAIVLVLVMLFVHLRRTLAPLSGAVDVLTALSRGDTSIRIDAEHRDEAGLIAEGITRLREEMLNLQVLREERQRERWRQESIVREELRELAGTLDDAGRQEILDDLQGAMVDAHAPGERNQLAVLAFVLHRLSGRIREQQERLHKLIEDLNDALQTKEAFAVLQQELEIARRMQFSILPRQFPSRPDVSLASFILPAKEVGGDFYDYFPLDDGRLGVVIADVSGKGVPAAFFMAICRTLLKVTARFLDSPAETVARVNALLAAENEEMMFVTLFYGILDPSTGEFVYANAGHNPPVLHSGDEVRLLPSPGGMALAVDESAHYGEARIQLQRDDVLFLYTDGVTEAQNSLGALFGDAALLETVASSEPGASVDALSDRVVTAIRQFAGEAPQADDITCVTLRFSGVG